MTEAGATNNNLTFLSGGGEMGELTRNFNWAETSLGPIEQWPQSLRTTVGLILHSSFPMFLWWGREDLVCFYNDAYRPSLGVEGRHPAIGKPGKEVWTDIWDTIGPLVDGVLNEGQSYWFEDALIPIYRNGKMEDVYWTFSYSPAYGDDGRIEGVLVTCTETTNRVKSIKQIAESEERFRTMAEGSDILIAVGDETGDATFFNNAWLELTGRPMDELLKFGWLDLVHPEDRERFSKIFYDAFNAKEKFVGDFRIRTKKGDYRWLLATGPPRFRSDGSFAGYISSCIDITETMEQQRQLENSNQQLQLTKEAAQLGSFDRDLVRNTVVWDERCREFFGIEHNEPIDYERDFLNNIHLEDRQNVIDATQKAFRREQSNGHYFVEYRTQTGSDNKVRWIRATGKAFFDENDTPIRLLGAVVDITEQKLDDIRKNDFIGMVSHELKTPLTSLHALMQVLSMKTKDSGDPFIGGAVEKAGVQVRKMNSLINGFLNISRLESGKLILHKSKFDITALIKHVIDEAHFTIPGRNIIFKNSQSLEIFADKDKIESVISNLVSNAQKYGAEDKPVIISCEKSETHVTVCVKDEGLGISPENQKNLFERYYRVENANTRLISGFGIGLYLCGEIINRHHGRIWVDSKLGEGSSFYFTVPLS